MRTGHRGGKGHQDRRDSARSEARTPTRADSTDPRYWPAPHWTHEMADEAVAANRRRYAAARAGAYLPPSREPVAEAWGELGAQRDAETVHRTDMANAAAHREAQIRQGLNDMRHACQERGRHLRSYEALPPDLWPVAAGILRRGRSLPLPSPEPGATRPLGPGAFAPLHRPPLYPDKLAQGDEREGEPGGGAGLTSSDLRGGFESDHPDHVP